MNACPSGKRSYQTQELAEEALIEARTVYHYSPGQGPIAVYQCEDCRLYHLTSRGAMNEKLKKLMDSGALKRSQEANHWAEKFKKGPRF